MLRIWKVSSGLTVKNHIINTFLNINMKNLETMYRENKYSKWVI